jgi:hypothetical protein
MSPKNGTLSIEYELAPDGRPRDIAGLVNKLLEADSKRIGRRFTFFLDGEFLHVVPTRTRSSSGEWIAQSSILDAKITIPEERRTVAHLFELLCQALSKTSGIAVHDSFYPLNAFYNMQTSLGANDEVARDVVVRMLRAFRLKLTWSLNYDPVTHGYYFNIEVVDVPSDEAKKPITIAPTRKGRPSPMSPKTASPRN